MLWAHLSQVKGVHNLKKFNKFQQPCSRSPMAQNNSAKLSVRRVAKFDNNDMTILRYTLVCAVARIVYKMYKNPHRFTVILMKTI